MATASAMALCVCVRACVRACVCVCEIKRVYSSRRRKSALGQQSSTANPPPAQTAAHTGSPSAYLHHEGYSNEYDEIADTSQRPADASADNYEQLKTTPPAPSVYAGLRQPDYVDCS